MIQNATKRCPKCGQAKNLEQFYRRSQSPSGRMSWCKECSDKHRVDYRNINRERILSVQRAYGLREKDKLAIKACERSLRRKLLIIAHYSNNTNRCACCGEAEIRFLSIDHINGNGNQHRKKIACSSGDPFYRWLVKEGMPDGYQVLCFNCNLACGLFGICPHKQDATNGSQLTIMKNTA